MEKAKKTRDKRVDFIRGVAIVLVVFGHCIQFGSGRAYLSGDLFFDDPAFKFIYGFHMALFALVSGYLFYHKDRRKPGDVLLRQFRSILIPLWTWATLDFVFTERVIGAGNGVIGNLILYKDHLLDSFWFLWAIFWYSCIVLLVSQVMGLDWLIPVSGVLALFIPDGYHSNLYVYLYPYFVIGYFFHKKEFGMGIVKKCNRHGWLTCICLFVIYGILMLFYTRDCYVYTTQTYLFGELGPVRHLCIDLFRWGVGLAGSAAVLWLCIQLCRILSDQNGIHRMMCMLGIDSMGIYIISGYLVKEIRRVYFIYQPNWIWWCVEAVIIIVVSVGVTCLLQKNRITRQLFLGGR